MATPKFRPYRGTDKMIQSKPYQPGYVYFSTDTGKIYLDYEDSRITMGGNGASVYYASDESVTEDKVSGRFQISLDDLDNPLDINNIKELDLIINIDGAFYKVFQVIKEENIAICDRIAISGTGGGGGSSGPGTGDGTDDSNYTKIELLSSFPKTYVFEKEYKIQVKATSKDEYVYIRYEIYGSDQREKIKTIETRSGETIDIDIGSNLFLGTNRVAIYAGSDNTDEGRPIENKGISCVEFRLDASADFQPLRVHEADKFYFRCIPIGNLEDRTLRVHISPSGKTEERILKSDEVGRTVNVLIPELTHGVHTITAELIANVNGREIISNALEYQVAIKVIEEGVEPAPIVWFPYGYSKKISQYDDLKIEFRVWSPAAEKGQLIETHFYREGVELNNSPRELSYNDSDSTCHIWNISEHVIGINNYSINIAGGRGNTITYEVEEDKTLNLDIISDDLVLNLASKGRSNSENSYSKTRWISNIGGKEVQVKFNNFNWYNNGWIDTKDGECLRISNGASIEIPLEELNVLHETKMKDPVTFEFRFKIRNVQEYSALIKNEEVVNPLTGKTEVKQTISTERSVIGSYFGSNRGFCLGTQEAFFKSKENLVSAKYREDEIISLSIVIDKDDLQWPLMYIYLNGILSGISKYSSSDEFNTGISSLTFNSQYCDVDLYNIRIYKAKLYSQDIVQNYIADRKDAKMYKANKIIEFKSNNIPTIKFSDMETYNENNPDETLMPYMVIESLTDDDLLPYVKGGKKPVNIRFINPALDYAYENKLITDEQYLLGAPSFEFTCDKDEEALDVQGTSSQSYPRRNFKWKAKQKKAEWKYLKGPLEGYPIYKYDKLASEEKGKDVYVGTVLPSNGKEYKKYHLDSPIGETTFCFKADYMESSGTHNTGYASFVSTLYTKHPLNYYYPDEDLDKGIRTTIYGFPMLVFQKRKNGEYEFVGRYNFNLDKGATDSCGFTYDIDSKVPNGNFKLDNKVNADNFNVKAQHYELIDNEYKEATLYVEGRPYYIKAYYPMEDIAECWEFKNNQGSRCSFKKLDFNETGETYREVKITESEFSDKIHFIYDPEDQTYKPASSFEEGVTYYKVVSGVLTIHEDFEYRYSAFEDEIDDALEMKGDFGTKTQAEANAYLLDKMKNLTEFITWVNSTDTAAATNEPFEAPITIGDEIYTKDSEEYRLAKFRSEFNDHLNMEYCEIYFIMTELLHLFDSRGKNMMMASWGPKVEGGNYIWFPIFYDIDTQLGINNSGVPTWDYDAEPTNNNQFSTANSVLWNNFYACFSTNIVETYHTLRIGSSKRKLNINALDGYYNARPLLDGSTYNSWKELLEYKVQINNITSFAKIGKRPIMIDNVDQYYKYINPTLSGYTNTSGNTKANDQGRHFYCLQGTRELSRYLYLRNRLNYVDSLWGAGDAGYGTIQDKFKLRLTANMNINGSGVPVTSDTYIVDKVVDGFTTISKSEFPHPLDSQGDSPGVRSYLKQYLRFYFDESPTKAVYCDGINPQTIEAPPAIKQAAWDSVRHSQQLMYVANPEYIADLGDLSVKYPDELLIGGLKRLKRFKLGSDIEGYFNNNMIGGLAFNFGFDTDGEPSYGLLEEVNLTNVGSPTLNTSVDFSGCEKLKIFRALGTQITGINLASGVQIETLHLPKTISGLTLLEPVALPAVLSSPGKWDAEKENEGFNKGLYIEGITNVEKSKRTGVIPFGIYKIDGGILGLDSYKLLSILFDFKESVRNDSTVSYEEKKLRINLTKVDWSPYNAIEYGTPYFSDQAKFYYYDDGRNGLVRYTRNPDLSWEEDTKSGLVYMIKEKYRDADGNLIDSPDFITNLDIFDTFINTYESAKRADRYDKNPYLNGNSSEAISYPEITGIIYIHNDESNKYSEADIINKYQAYFPKLTFFFKHVENSYRSVYVTSIDGVEKIIYTECKDKETTDLTLTYPDLKLYEPIRLNYDFIGWSLNKNASPESTGVYHPELTENFTEEWRKIQYTTTDEIIKFYAIYDLTKYNIYFKNYYRDGRIEDIALERVPAGEYLYSPDVLPVTDESGLEDNERYKLLGWVADTQYCFPDNESEGRKHLVSLENIISENVNRVYYACYIKELVTNAPTDAAYFNFEGPQAYNDGYDTSYNIAQGYVVTPGNGVSLKGKITIPSTYNGLPVIGISGITGQTGLTHIYFYGPETIRTFQSISSNPDLVYIDYPVGLRDLYTQSLANNAKLRHPDGLKNTKLAHIGNNAFMGSFDVSLGEITLFQLPGTITAIDTRGVANIQDTSGLPDGHYRIRTVSFGGPKDPCNLDLGSIGNTAFIFTQKNLYGTPPVDEGASSTTPIKTFIYYRPAGSSTPSQEAFEEFVRSTKVMESTKSVLEIAVIDADV